MLQRLKGNKIISFLTLFTSFSTLLCCAIPSSLVLLGFGASLAGFLSEYPEFIWLSENKGGVFGISFFFLFVSLLSQKISQKNECPVDKNDACKTTKNWTKRVLVMSFTINLIGFTYAFILPMMM